MRWAKGATGSMKPAGVKRMLRPRQPTTAFQTIPRNYALWLNKQKKHPVPNVTSATGAVRKAPCARKLNRRSKPSRTPCAQEELLTFTRSTTLWTLTKPTANSGPSSFEKRLGVKIWNGRLPPDWKQRLQPGRLRWVKNA